jgi:hypothetical protein
MLKLVLKSMLVSVLATTPFVVADPAYCWDCSSKCRAWQPDCYAWKKVNCTNPCLAFHINPQFTQAVVVMRNTKPRLREMGITDKKSCQARAPEVAAIVTAAAKGNALAGAMSVPFTRCACDQAL